jgi:hypothetical protein
VPAGRFDAFRVLVTSGSTAATFTGMRVSFGMRSCSRPPAAGSRSIRRVLRGPFADRPDMDHRLELETPTGLKPGQFQGVFFENVETEYTGPALRK